MTRCDGVEHLVPVHQASVAGALSADLTGTATDGKIKPEKKGGAKQLRRKSVDPDSGNSEGES